MRVFLVVWWFDKMGGMERHVTALGCALAARGHDVTVFTEMPLPRTNTYGRQLRAAGIPVVTPRPLVPRNANDGVPEALRGIVARGDYNRRTRSIFRSLEDAHAAAAPDVVHIHGCRLGQQWIAEWGAARALPVVYTEHTTLGDWGGPHDADAPFAIWASAGALACVSAHSRESLRRILPAPREIGISRHIIPAPPPHVPEPGTALCVARLAPHKGIDVLLDALWLLKRDGVVVPLKIAGSGEARAALTSQAGRLGLSQQVEFLGQVPPARLAALWSGCLFGVLPSRTEGLPLSIAEGMSHGRPVIATQVGGIPEVVADGQTGLLVPPEDAPALARTMRHLVENPQTARLLGAAALRAFETGGWSEDAAVAETLATYNSARSFPRPQFCCAAARSQAHAAVAKWRRVIHITFGMGSLGDGEQEISDLAVALRWAGADVSVILDSILPKSNRYSRQLRQAGVPVHSPSLTASKLRPGGALRMLAAACAQRKPAVVHLHFWSGAKLWTARAAIRNFALDNQIPLVETDRSLYKNAPLPEDPHARLAFLSDGSRPLDLVRRAVDAYERSLHAGR